MAQPVNMWAEFKTVLKQLKTDEAHATFKNIVIDTADIAYDLCEKYICTQNSVSAINEIPFGQGWSKAAKEFDEMLRSIPQMGYGLVLISHAQDKSFTDEAGKEFNQIVPTLGNKPRLIVDRMSDIIGYANPVQDDDGTTHTVLYMRGTPRFVAGSRFKYTPDSIEFTYQNLVDAIGEAIDKQAQETGGKFVTNERTTAHNAQSELDFDELMTTFNDIVQKIQEASGSAFATNWAPRITFVVEKYLGKGKRASDLTRDQVEQLSLIVNDLKDEVGKGI